MVVWYLLGMFLKGWKNNMKKFMVLVCIFVMICLTSCKSTLTDEITPNDSNSNSIDTVEKMIKMC